MSIIKKKKIKPVVVAWVLYECGCSEGIWVSIGKRCIAHDKPVVDTTMVVSLRSPFERQNTNFEF